MATRDKIELACADLVEQLERDYGLEITYSQGRALARDFAKKYAPEPPRLTPEEMQVYLEKAMVYVKSLGPNETITLDEIITAIGMPKIASARYQLRKLLTANKTLIYSPPVKAIKETWRLGITYNGDNHTSN